MKILLTGPTGQVGSALLGTLPALGIVVPVDRGQLDLLRPDSIRAAVRATRPDVIVNAAAYTAVDRAEKEESIAFRINRDGPALLADEAATLGALLVHFSTDYVFDGEKPTPYVETDVPNPLNVYGRSKLGGEQAIQGSGCRHLIFRTSWIYGTKGNNFMLTMMRLAREQKPLRVVDDQHGAPTTSAMIAAAIPHTVSRVLSEASPGGLYHMSAAGSTTWCAFARAFLRTEIRAISSAEYPTAARRPRNSLLDNSKLDRTFNIRLPSWEAGLQEVLLSLGTD